MKESVPVHCFRCVDSRHAFLYRMKKRRTQRPVAGCLGRFGVRSSCLVAAKLKRLAQNNTCPNASWEMYVWL